MSSSVSFGKDALSFLTSLPEPDRVIRKLQKHKESIDSLNSERFSAVFQRSAEELDASQSDCSFRVSDHLFSTVPTERSITVFRGPRENLQVFINFNKSKQKDPLFSQSDASTKIVKALWVNQRKWVVRKTLRNPNIPQVQILYHRLSELFETIRGIGNQTGVLPVYGSAIHKGKRSEGTLKISVYIKYCKQGDLLSWIEESCVLTAAAEEKKEEGEELEVEATELQIVQNLEAQKYKFAWQILHGLFLLHKYKIIHGDIKPENIFLSRGSKLLNADLGDFGKSAFLSERRKSVLGTSGYISPENLADPSHEMQFSDDIWAAGTTLYLLFCGNFPSWSVDVLPDDGASSETWYEKIRKESFNKDEYQKSEWRRLLGQCCIQEMQQLIFGMLSLNPKDRPNAEDCMKVAEKCMQSISASRS